MEKPVLPEVRVVKVGSICYEVSEIPSVYNLQLKSNLGISGGSTVTLIKSNRTILVDTGYDFEWISTAENDKTNADSLIQALKSHNIKPGKIDIVFITHWHKDHFGNIDIFKNATITSNKDVIDRLGINGVQGISDGEQICKGVKVIETPGHTIDHTSLIVNTTINGIHVRFAIAGDAVISHSYFQTGKIWRYNSDFYDANEAKKSIRRIISSSDVIIPGHGAAFMTYKPEWLFKE